MSDSPPRSSNSPQSEPAPGSERRGADRIEVMWSVDCETDDTFLYASITNISEMGIFVSTRDPLELGAQVRLRFAPPASTEAFVLRGHVQWINPVRLLSENRNPGMGILFHGLTADDRERIVELIRTIAYVRDSAN